jgi:hypothetical protein
MSYHGRFGEVENARLRQAWHVASRHGWSRALRINTDSKLTSLKPDCLHLLMLQEKARAAWNGPLI